MTRAFCWVILPVKLMISTGECLMNNSDETEASASLAYDSMKKSCWNQSILCKMYDSVNADV